MPYDQIAHVVKIGGTVAFTTVFLGAILYALWPKNKDRFDRAARMPLNESDAPQTDSSETGDGR